MKKKVYCILLILGIGSVLGQNNYLHVHYDVELDYELTNNPTQFDGILKSAKGESIYTMNFKASNMNSVTDSSYTSATGTKHTVTTKHVYVKSKGFQILKQINDSLIYDEKGIKGKRYLLEDPLYFTWDIVQDSTKIIMGYQTFLAKTHFRGRDYHAYFTPDLPYNDGPYKFYGLPGLILEIKSTDNVVQFTAVAIKTIEQDLVFDGKLKAIKNTYSNRTLARNDFVKKFKQKLKAFAKYAKSQSSGSQTYRSKSYSRSIELDLYTDN